MQRRRRAAPQAEEDQARKALDRTAGMLRQYQRSGLTMVAIEDVLTLLGAEPDSAPAPQEPPRDPRADPLTGALWAGPAGSLPPGG